jgi:hypothetical protein
MLGLMGKSAVIWCGPDDPQKVTRDPASKLVRLQTYPDKNLYLKAENISNKLLQELPPLVMDMLEVGSYVYCADQAISRGGDKWRNHGEDWYRDFQFHIPVRDPDFWSQSAIKESLIGALSFLSEDYYDFDFRKLTVSIPQETYFDYNKGQLWFDADEVLMFSGGLDSLSGAIDEIINNGKNVALVSHRPVSKIASWQASLLGEFEEYAEANRQFLHIPVWINKDRGLSRDVGQRARSFLYSILGAAVAYMYDTNRVLFYENGIVSCNLPFSSQIGGAKASRSTHPKTLRLLSEFYSNLFDKKFTVENPFIWKTKSDIVQLIKKAGMTELIAQSRSCGHVRQASKVQNHCGVCTQCIERRLATLFNDISDEDDPENQYVNRLFLDPLEDTKKRTEVESYIKHAMKLRKMPDNEFISRFGEIHRIQDQLNLPTSVAAQKLYELHQHHGEQVCCVVQDQVKKYSEKIIDQEIHPRSLLAALIGQPMQKKRKYPVPYRFPTPHGTKWEDITIEIVSKDSIRVVIGDISKRYMAHDIGFRDLRKGDLLNQLWELFLTFAENDGKYSWASTQKKPGAQKDVQRLKRLLSEFFGINSSPISNYKKGIGWITHFTIRDISYRN